MLLPNSSRLLRAIVSLFVLVNVLALAAAPVAVQGAPRRDYHDPTWTVAARVADLLPRMTLDEKIGQITQADSGGPLNRLNTNDITTYFLGSVLSGGGSDPAAGNSPTAWADMYDSFQNAALATRLGIPLIYGVDAVHGHSNVVGATIFPHNIGLGATRNPTLIQQVGQATAEEVAGTGIDWTFSPCLCVARNERWGRTYESFGEDPALVQSMTTIVNGYQGGALNNPTSILATAKHYLGDGGTTGGVDQGDTQLTEAQLRAIHLPPFQSAVQRGVGSVMISFSSWNGQKLHGHQYLITSVLKNELGFSGIVVTDWAGIDQLPGDYASDVRTSINAGIDMVMVPNNYTLFISTLRSEVNAGRVAMSRIDDAVTRILTKKFELGLFENPLTNRSYTSGIGSAAHRAVARQAVRESLVLLKNNNNILPLSKTTPKIFVAGKSADNIGYQSGGWTIDWQGASGNITPGTTLLQAIRNAAPTSTVTYSSNGSGVNNTYNVAIAVIGETPYAESDGDRTGSMGLDTTDINTLNTLKAAGIPIVVILISGRPLVITNQLPDWAALVAAWLPGTEGQGVADVLFGDYNFTGKLPQTWPQSESQIPINVGDATYNPLFAFGFGLSYGSNPTNTPTRTGVVPTNTPTRTPTGVIPTNTRTRTPTRTATGPTPTRTRTRTPTRTPTGGTPLPTNTATRTNTPATVIPTNTPTRTPTGIVPTNTPTRTPTGFVPTNTPTRTSTTGPTPTPTPTTGGACSPVTSTITAPFTFDGAGTFCWQSSNLGTFINSWNTTSVTLNGVNVTNVYVAASSYPAKINGYWYVSYNSTVAWGHFEAK